MWLFYLITAFMIVCSTIMVLIMCSCFINCIHQLCNRRPRGIEETVTTRIPFDLSPSRTNIHQVKLDDKLLDTDNHEMEIISTTPLNHMENESNAKSEWIDDWFEWLTPLQLIISFIFQLFLKACYYLCRWITIC